MDRQAVPELSSFFFSEVVGERLGDVDVQVIHHQMNRSGFGVAANDRLQRFGELRRFPIGRCQGEMLSGQRLDGAEQIGGSASFVFVVRPADLSRRQRPGRSYVGMQRDRLLVKATTGSEGL